MKLAGLAKTGLLLLTFLVLAAPETLSARPEFARYTGQSCGSCHVSALGGGSLTPDGEAFRESLEERDIAIDPSLRLSTGQRLLHIFLWLIHIPFGIGWVGLFSLTFFPALKREGLAIPPRPYIRQMLYSIIVIAVTGPAMVYLKLRASPSLLETRFGMLLILKIAAVLALFAATVVLIRYTTVLLSRRYRGMTARIEEGRELGLSTGDLMLFNGSEKRKALVAVDGEIFDVTGRDLWRKGIHPGGHRAGHDLSGEFDQAPHGKEVLDRVSPVGRLSLKPKEKQPRLKWAFVTGIAASMIILGVVALWRW